MQTKIKLLSMALFSLLVISCSDKKDPIAVKKAQLEKLKDQQSKLITDIAKLEKEILKEYPNAIPAKPKLVKLVSLE